jgi:N-acetylglucosamine-6-sulfatase
VRLSALLPLAGAGVLARILFATATVASLAVGTATSAGSKARAQPPASAPNFILIVVDDQADNSFKARYMPQTFRWLVDRGTRFERGLAAPPLCCPDRAGLLTGDYPHNSGVFWDNPGYAALTDKGDTLPVWLGHAGYRTGLVGKFMNHYDDFAGLGPAPGFDYWFNLLGEKRYYRYDVSDQGLQRHFGRARRDYSSDVFTRAAKRFIHRSAHGARPFFLWLGYDAPHTAHSNYVAGCSGNDPVPPNSATLRPFQGVRLPKPPSFNERDVSDKPPNIADRPRIDRSVLDNIRRRFHCTLGADRQVDRDIARLQRELHRDGELSNTIVFYVSDNGYFFGEHRIPRGKTLPYEPALRVPYAVHVPPRYRAGPQPRVDRHLVTNEDIPATILDFAGDPQSCAAALDCRTLDGRSLRPLLGGSRRWPPDRAVLSEISGANKRWRSVRTPRYLYVRYEGGDRELYDLRRDPDELRNVASEPSYSRVERALARRLGRLRHCAGIKGRDQQMTGAPFCE